MNVYIPILILNLLYLKIFCIKFDIESGKERCIGDEVNKDILVKGQYKVSSQPGGQLHVSIYDSKHSTLYSQKNKDNGEFSFSTDDFDIFKVCFKSFSGTLQKRTVFLDIKFGSEAKDYKEMAELEKLKPLDVKLKMVQDLSKEIVKNFDELAVQERKMNQTNESTHSRILYLSIFSIVCVIGLAVWQAMYLKKYFRTRKLID
ncbi:Endoplasmic reticulum vesicle protein 25 [Intoshia linei]|uniref:Endoplasmic reticulum vesicle protein 25 n=1 Tax=Intoshia linei TaxID=1819745 RepID=A0A177B4C8_9BILA|nr:Endoplasmic reticulum vesicle protein 25 [Intoshia linei]